MRTRAMLLMSVLLLVVAGCGDDAPSTATMDPPPSEPDVYIDAVFADGFVAGVGPVVEVGIGDIVSISVTSDVADEVHIHGGYDLFVDVPRDQTVTFWFIADRPGVFLVEMEAAGYPLFDLDVG